MTTTKEDQMRAEFEKRMLDIAPMNLSRNSEGDYNEMCIDARWGDYKLTAESYEQKLAELRAIVVNHERNICDLIRDYEKKLAEKDAEMDKHIKNSHHFQDVYVEANARNARMEPLRRDVAMLHENLSVARDLIDLDNIAAYPQEIKLMDDAISDTQATAEAYEREVAAKALENAGWKMGEEPRTILFEMANELRAAHKGKEVV